MGRWFVGQKNSDGSLMGLGCDNEEEAYAECADLNRGFSSFLGAQDYVGTSPYKVYDFNEEMEGEPEKEPTD